MNAVIVVWYTILLHPGDESEGRGKGGEGAGVSSPALFGYLP